MPGQSCGCDFIRSKNRSQKDTYILVIIINIIMTVSTVVQVLPPPGQAEAKPARVRRPPERLCPPLGQERLPGDRHRGDGHR